MMENKEAERKRILRNTATIVAVLTCIILLFIFFFRMCDAMYEKELAEKERLAQEERARQDRLNTFIENQVNSFILSIQEELRTVEPNDIRLDAKLADGYPGEGIHGAWTYRYEVTFSSTRIDELSQEYMAKNDAEGLYNLLKPAIDISDNCILWDPYAIEDESFVYISPDEYTFEDETFVIEIEKKHGYPCGLEIIGDSGHVYTVRDSYDYDSLYIDSETVYLGRSTFKRQDDQPSKNSSSQYNSSQWNSYPYDDYDYYEYDNAYDYYDPYDFYLDNEDEFEDYEEAEDYYYERWGE